MTPTSAPADQRDALRRQLHARTDRVIAAALTAQWPIAIAVAAGGARGGSGGSAAVVAVIAAGPVLVAPALALLALLGHLAPLAPVTSLGHLAPLAPITSLGHLAPLAPVAPPPRRPAWAGTRHAIVAAQGLWSALLIAAVGDGAPVHLHVLASLALVALYRDWRLLATAAAVLWAAGAAAGAPPLPLLCWLAAAGAPLAYACALGARELEAAALREARLAQLGATVDHEVAARTVELADTFERYRRLIESSEAVAFEYDPDAGRLLYIGPQAMQLLGCTRAQLDDPAFLASRIHPGDRVRVAHALDGILRSGRPPSQPIDCRALTANRGIVHTRTFLGESAPRRPGGGRRICGTTFDVTRQRARELDRQQSQKLESVGRLAAGVAHEINTPIQFVGDSVEFVRGAVADLTAALAAQRVVVEGVLAGAPARAAAERADELCRSLEVPFLFEELPRSLERACDGIERVARIVRSMRTFAHPDELEMVDVDLNRAIEATLTIARNEYRYVADVATDLGELPPVRCHAGEINQVILNIVINAAHAITEVVGETGGRGLIAVRTRRAGERVEIAITDTGTGIPDHVATRIFDPFFTTKAVDRGTGQGLAIAHAVVVEKHGGTLTFDTVVGGGTTFYIRLPIAQDPARRLEAA